MFCESYREAQETLIDHLTLAITEFNELKQELDDAEYDSMGV